VNPSTRAASIGLIGFLALACGSEVSEIPIDPEEQLARAHCGSCHLYTPPEAITKEGWKPVLSFMAVLMGLQKPISADPPEELGNRRDAAVRIKEMLRAGLSMDLTFPKEPILDPEIFRRIVRFYLQNAPENPLPQSDEKLSIKDGPTPFQVGPKIVLGAKREQMVAMVRIDENAGRVIIGGWKGPDAKEVEGPNYLAVLSREGHVTQELTFDSTPVSLVPMGEDFLLTTVGDLKMRQASNARLYRLTDENGELQRTLLKENLFRAAGATLHPESDGSRLIAFNGFGFQTGALTLFREKDGAIVSSEDLSQQPGAMVSQFDDFNGDGLTDLLTLFSQHLEQLILFIQKKDGSGFESHEILKNFPVWGTSYFEAKDFNGDGNLDLVVSNGDNGDYKDPPLKNYHGIRVYLWEREDSSGAPEYREVFFQPMYGAFKVLARDFDRDGDYDLAAISHYPDLNAKVRENFLYFENKSRKKSNRFQFEISAFPELKDSSFVSMDAGDLDGDGDLDIALGGNDSQSFFLLNE
jgi:hypothetical protein